MSGPGRHSARSDAGQHGRPTDGPPSGLGAWPAPRLLGVDAARGLALLGMMATHLFPFRTPDGDMTVAYALADGRASALFAVLAGMSLALADGGPSGGVGSYRTMLTRVAVRALLVGAVGLLLAELGTNILIILAYYAVLFLLVAPLVRLPAPLLAGLALGWAVVGPVVSHAVRAGLGLQEFVQSPSLGALVADPARVLTALLLTGTYPAVTWLAYALAGAALGRAVLRPGALGAVAVAGLTLAVGAYLASSALLARATPVLEPLTGGRPLDGNYLGTTPTTSWWWLAVGRPHSGTPFDMLATIGSSVLVIAIMLLVVRGPMARAFLWLTAAGSMTLTLYSLHIVMVSLDVGEPAPPSQVWLLQVGIVLLLGMAWRVFLRRGPLEAVVARTVDLVAPRRGRRSATAA